MNSGHYITTYFAQCIKGSLYYVKTKCTYLELHSRPHFFRSCVSWNDLPCVGGVVAWAAADACRSHDGCQLRTAEEEEGGGKKAETNTSINSAELDLKASNCNRSPISYSLLMST